MVKLNVRQIEAFRAVMIHGSMTKAAQMLDVSTPAMSRLIASLTDSVGFALFVRENGGIMPTEDALLLVKDIERVFLGIDEISQRVDAIRNKEAGLVRVVAMAHYVNDLLPEIVAAFCVKYPRVNVVLEAQRRIDIPDSIMSGRRDIGITSLPVRSKDISVQKIISRPAVVAMPQDSRLASKLIIEASDLADERFISFASGTALRYHVDELFDRLDIRRNLILEATSQEAVCALVAAGAGISVVSPFSSILYDNPKLAVRQFSPAISVEVGLLVAERRLSTITSTFRDFLLDHLRSQITMDRYSA
jgi:DNA-binding transcriptional LysR family regulator